MKLLYTVPLLFVGEVYLVSSSDLTLSQGETVSSVQSILWTIRSKKKLNFIASFPAPMLRNAFAFRSMGAGNQ